MKGSSLIDRSLFHLHLASLIISTAIFVNLLVFSVLLFPIFHRHLLVSRSQKNSSNKIVKKV